MGIFYSDIKTSQQTIARENPQSCHFDLFNNANNFKVSGKDSNSVLFVSIHETTVACYIGAGNSGKLTFKTLIVHGRFP